MTFWMLLLVIAGPSLIGLGISGVAGEVSSLCVHARQGHLGAA